jgi:geranyl-CoA carboxylase alpha subunit
MPAPLHKILVANRGEIALRIIRSARDLGLRSVAVFSEADAAAPHVEAADQAVCIGPPPPRDSYLCIDALLAAAEKTGADGLHPGYGFLAENAQLAARCAGAGVTFVGPPAEAIRLMGDKARAKARMLQAEVPCVPGYAGADQDQQTFAAEAGRLGFPLLIKAVEGGGGRGMRVVQKPEQLSQELASARAEAEGAFGNGDLMLERLVERARHVEIQVFADSRGNTIHLGERECSAQRRHQKIIEESPSPAVDAELRERMGAAAVAAARAIGYVGAGTVEFLLAPDGAFYFMEMNTRLQVEHPVTELVTGLDLVAWQLLVAAGEPLPLSQAEVSFSGHAIEARIYAEDPYAGFLPHSGRVLLWRPVARRGVRVDGGVAEGQKVPPHYDPMIAKVIAHGETRELARSRLAAALSDSPLLGPLTNRSFLVQLLGDPEFVAGEVHTATLDQRFARQPPQRPLPEDRDWALAAVVWSLARSGWPDPWRNSAEPAWPLSLEAGGRRRELRITHRGGQLFSVQLDGGEALELALLGRRDGALRFACDGVQRGAYYALCGERLQLEVEGVGAVYVEPPPAAASRVAGASGGGQVRAPIAGGVLAVNVAAGDEVQPDQCVVLLEAMKMEHRVLAGRAGRVLELLVAAGDQVSARQVLLTVGDPEDGGPA